MITDGDLSSILNWLSTCPYIIKNGIKYGITIDDDRILTKFLDNTCFRQLDMTFIRLDIPDCEKNLINEKGFEAIGAIREWVYDQFRIRNFPELYLGKVVSNIFFLPEKVLYRPNCFTFVHSFMFRFRIEYYCKGETL